MDLPPLVDTHCHLDSPQLAPDRAAVLDRARAAGLTDIILAGVWRDGFALLRTLARNAPPGVRLHVALGLHPQALVDVPETQDAAALEALRAQCRVQPPVAVGECGLDYRVDLGRAPKARQRAVLRAHLALAQELEVPVLLHCLAAHEDLVRDLDAVGPLPAGGVMHSFSGSAEQVEPFTRRGLHLSFAGPVSWPGARRPRAAAARCPANRLLCETDAPYQAPEPHNRQRNEPAYLVHVLAALAAARGEPVQEVAQRCTANARALFHLP